uniref:ZP domain-containing protein n=1 Tax=Plectus sambesii TaxID=2011161 RepID=A0A914X104_9BILA
MVIDIKPRRFAFRAIGRLSECGGGKREREMLTREMSQKLSVAAAFLLPLLVHSVPIDNGVAGRPWISCENDMIILNARTEKPFVGRVFVKGMSKNAECAREYNEPIDTSAELQISMGSCQMRRQRYIEPAGMQQSIIVIVSFHPVFLTKVDMAYNIRMLTPTDLYSEEAMTPKCEYTIRLDSKEGPLAQYAVVGQTLFHVWRCETAPTDGILVKNCVIRDNSNMVYNALDDLGCPADKHVVGSLSYNAELNEAYVEVHAFKFAD